MATEGGLSDTTLGFIQATYDFSKATYERTKAFLTKNIEQTRDDINNFATMLQDLTNKSINNGVTFLGGMISNVESSISSVASQVSKIERTVSGIADQVINDISMKLEIAIDDISKKIRDVSNDITNAVNDLGNKITQDLTNIDQNITYAKDFLTGKIQEGTETVINGVSALKQTTEQGFTNVIAQANFNLQTTVNAVAKSAKDVMDQASAQFDKTIDFINTGITGLAQGFSDLFENFQSFFQLQFQGLQSWIEGLFMIDEDALYQRMSKLADKYIAVQKANIRNQT